jgi:RNA polymerase sigma-70 factor (ECF subfamily)
MLFIPTALMSEDEELLESARLLDSRALAAIHDRYYPDVFRYILFKTGDNQTADDLTSEVFMRLLDAFQAGRPPETLRAWLFGVAGHLIADHFRRQLRRPQTPLADDVPSSVADPESQAQSALTSRAVRQALQQLTDEQQQVLAMRFSEGRSIADTAALLNKTETAVKQLQFRAVAAMRRLLEDVHVK